MAKRTRSGSATDMINMALEASKPLAEPPKHIKLAPKERPFWTAIIKCKPPNDWSDSDYILVAQLARLQASIEDEIAQLAKEGLMVKGKINQRSKLVDLLTKRQGVLMRTLRLAGTPQGMTGTSARQDVHRNRAFRAATRAKAEIGAEGDNLLA